MTCDELLQRLDDYVEDTLSPDVRAQVDAHLESCPGCRAEADALATVVRDTRGLPRSLRPESDLWSGIAPRLAPRRRFRFAAGDRWNWPLRAAAAIALVAAGAAIGAYSSREPASNFAQEQARYTAATAELAAALAQDPGRISLASREVVAQNLAILDQAIREAETALAADPGNPSLEQMLVARYEQRLDLLRRAGATGRQVS